MPLLMPFTVRIDENGYVEVMLSGRIDMLALMEASALLHEQVSPEVAMRQLWDARQVASMEVSPEDAVLLDECVVSLRELGYEVAGRRAVVTTDGYVAEAAALLAELLEPLDVQLRTFRDVEEARAWAAAAG